MTCSTAVSPQDVTPAQLTTDVSHSFGTNTPFIGSNFYYLYTLYNIISSYIILNFIVTFWLFFYKYLYN